MKQVRCRAAACLAVATLLGACGSDSTEPPVTVSAPTGVTASAVGTTAIHLTWNQVANASQSESGFALPVGALAAHKLAAKASRKNPAVISKRKRATTVNTSSTQVRLVGVAKPPPCNGDS